MINVAKEMEHLHKLAGDNQDTRFPRLWEKIITEEWLSQAWEEIRRNKGSQTPGIDKLTAEDVDLSVSADSLKDYKTARTALKQYAASISQRVTASCDHWVSLPSKIG